jgi:hypothetical protein
MFHLRLNSVFFFVSHVIFLAVLLQPIAAVGVDSSFPTRMFCSGPLPPGRYGESYNTNDPKTQKARELLEKTGEAMNWSAKNFTILSDLCTMHGKLGGNLGGQVRTSTVLGFPVDLVS